MMKNTVFNYDKKEIIGLVNSVDTGMSTAVINDDSTLSQLQVNQLLAVQSPKSGRFIIAMIIKIYRKASNIDDEEKNRRWSFACHIQPGSTCFRRRIY